MPDEIQSTDITVRDHIDASVKIKKVKIVTSLSLEEEQAMADWLVLQQSKLFEHGQAKPIYIKKAERSINKTLPEFYNKISKCGMDMLRTSWKHAADA